MNPASGQLLTGYSQESGGVLTAPSGYEDETHAGGVEPLEVSSAPVYDAVPEIYTPDKVAAGYAPLLTQPGAPALTGGENQSQGEQAPVDIQADQMAREEATNIVSAAGDVMIMQDGRILRADEVQYDLNTDQARARGYVVLNEENGDIHLADRATYNNRLRDGSVDNLRTTLNDGSRFTAVHGELQGGTKTVMDDATYTPCEPCKSNPDKAPTWSLVASEVEHDQDAQRVSYKNARFELMGVPVAYTPYFSHPDGTVMQKSGFLTPSFGFKSDLGVFATNNYYWAIAPDQDATFGAMVMTEQAPLALAEYRKRWENASFQVNGGLTSSDRTDRSGGVDIDENDEVRGHVISKGLWDMNDKWRSGFNINYASDDQYMRQYNITNDDVLENEIYAERFSGRNYAAARVLAFQDVRIRETPLDQPNILPEIVASFKGEPGAVPVVKGQWYVDTEALGLQRDNDEQDMQRFSVDAGWKRRLVSDYGLLTRIDGSVRNDVYFISDRTIAAPGSGRSTDKTENRIFPQLHMQSSYPVARPFETFQARVEPLAALTFAPNLNDEDSIPNEDSNDVQIDASNLFNRSRFPGRDRFEDRSRVTYGLRTGVYGYSGSFGDVFLGQSYRFDDRDNPFPDGSGLQDQSSDIVGQVAASYKNIYDLNYRFQLGQDNLASERHEIDAMADWNRLRLQGTYLYAGALEGTDITESREQIDGNAALYFSKEWRTRVGALQDLGSNPGLRRAYVGLDHLGQCIFWSLTAQRNYTRDASGESNTEIFFRVGLKNLGEFEESALRPANQAIIERDDL